MNATAPKSKKRKLFRFAKWVFLTLIAFILGVFVTAQFTPWPSALLIRYVFKKGGAAANENIKTLVPKDIIAHTDIRYSNDAEDMLLDLYYPNTEQSHQKYPLIVWVHGGGFVGGDKAELSNYCKILANNGYVVAVPNYSLAPSVKYPIPVQQINTAIAFLSKKNIAYPINHQRIAIAGDSGGAHIAAQLANIITNSGYAKQMDIKPAISPEILKSVILYCGPYNIALVDIKNPSWFITTVLWSYTGLKKLDIHEPKVKLFSVTNFISGHFPPTFISVGNNDPLSAHSHELAAKLSAKGVIVDSLFFTKDYTPALPHEYQFNLHSPEGKLALTSTLKFLDIKMLR